MMHTIKRIETSPPDISRMSPADFLALKDRIIREARIARTAAIHAAFARAITAITAFATRRHTDAAATVRPIC
jgi:hypothetical protein